ncbi:MAG: RluA family pseudouridine synthase [Prevotella sp.]|jgi:23S rRNA pseudouridine1911/1915/1917 synthase|nr:RluA family pseudouridine synthase [Prevotella sp.]
MTDIFFDGIEDLPENEPAEEQEDPCLYEHYRFVADKGQGMTRVDKYLAMHIVGVSRNRIQQAAEANCILVNDSPVRSNYRIKPLDVISVVMNRPPRDFEIIPEDIPLDVVYEDDDLLVINKPPGLVVHPGFGNYQGTMVNAVAYRLKDTPEYDAKDPRPGIVHRIDKDTSGLIVVAKNPYAKAHLSTQFFNKTTRREYVALVWGLIKENEGRIEGNIGRDPKDRMLMSVFKDGEHGKPAVTHYSVLERLGYVTLIRCRLETGRTHQIRVHMKYTGHTLFNDVRYGGNEVLKGTHFAKYRQFVQNCFNICPRQALHARTLGFVQPRTGEELTFEAPIPGDMSQLLEKWREYTANREI